MTAEGSPPVRRVLILGSTGSIGTQSIEVISHLNTLAAAGTHGTRYEIVGLAAGTRGEELARQAHRLGVHDLALSDPQGACDPPEGATLRRGPDAAERLVREVEADLVIAAMVGFAGVAPTLTAIELGRDVALANKETLVAAGGLIVPAARKSSAALLPLDSEHSALWQCLGLQHRPPFTLPHAVERLVLTASGGALRDWPIQRIADATPEQALAHPTWDMGAKVTIDSASMINKAFELLEAHWLFGAGPDQLGALIHPQSIVHSLVEFRDGSVMAQLGDPDMRGPIQMALTGEARPPGIARKLDLNTLSRLEFIEPDPQRYPALGLAYEVMQHDQRAGEPTTAGAIFNGANEAAVEAFIAGRMRFGMIAEITAEALRSITRKPLRSLADAEHANAEARALVEGSLASVR